MKLLVTENLVSDINKLNSFNITLEKMSIKDIPNQAQSLFKSDKFKFIFDEFITITSFNKLNINTSFADCPENYPIPREMILIEKKYVPNKLSMD